MGRGAPEGIGPLARDQAGMVTDGLGYGGWEIWTAKVRSRGLFGDKIRFEQFGNIHIGCGAGALVLITQVVKHPAASAQSKDI